MKINLLRGLIQQHRPAFDWRAFLLGSIITIGIGIGLAAYGFITFWPRPGPISSPAPSQVIISPPAPAQVPMATIHGQVSGTARRIRASTRPQETRSETAEGIYTPPPISSPPPADGQALVGATPSSTPSPPEPKPEPAFLVGDRAEGTVQGEIEIVDARGRPLTSEPLQVEGDYSLEFPGPEEARLSLQFTSPAVLEIHEPTQAVRLGTSAGWMADRPYITIAAGYERRWQIGGGLEVRAEVGGGWAWTPERAGPFGQVEMEIKYRF